MSFRSVCHKPGDDRDNSNFGDCKSNIKATATTATGDRGNRPNCQTLCVVCQKSNRKSNSNSYGNSNSNCNTRATDSQETTDKQQAQVK